MTSQQMKVQAPVLGDTEPARGERMRRAREAQVGEGRTGEESATE